MRYFKEIYRNDVQRNEDHPKIVITAAILIMFYLLGYIFLTQPFLWAVVIALGSCFILVLSYAYRISREPFFDNKLVAWFEQRMLMVFLISCIAALVYKLL